MVCYPCRNSLIPLKELQCDERLRLRCLRSPQECSLPSLGTDSGSSTPTAFLGVPGIVHLVSGSSRRCAAMQRTLPPLVGSSRVGPHGLALTATNESPFDFHCRETSRGKGSGSPHELAEIATMIWFALHLVTPGRLSSS